MIRRLPGFPFVGVLATLGFVIGVACSSGQQPTPTPTSAPASPTATTAAPRATNTPVPTPTPAEQAKRGGTLTFGQTVRSLDIGDTASHQWGDMGAISNLYSQLLRYSITDRETVEGDLAETWSVSDDGTVWKFKIRQGVVDHQGTAYGAEQVAYQMYRYVARPNKFPARRQTCWQSAVKETHWPPQAGDGVEFSGNEVTVRLKASTGWFLGCVAQYWSQFGPMKYYQPIDQEAKYRELDPDKGEIVGTGPFKFSEYVRDNKEVFVRNDKFFRSGKPYLDGFTVFNLGNMTTLLANFTAGRIDGICCFTTPSVSEATALKKEMGSQVVVPETLALGWAGFVLNVQRAPLGPVNDPSAQTIRKAIQLFLDRDRLNKLVYQDSGWPSFYYFYQWDWIYSRDQWEQKPGFNPKTKAQDVAEAKRLMESLGYSPTNMLKFDMLCGDTGTGRKECEVVAEDLKQIHIQVNARLQSDTNADQAGGKFDMTYVVRGYTFEDPEDYDGSLFLPAETGNSNWGHWADERYSKLYEEQRHLNDKKQRGPLLRQMADILYDSAGFIPTNRSTALQVYRGNWRGWTPNRIHVMNLSLENVWLSSDKNATQEMLQKHDIYTKFPERYPLK